MGKKALFTGSFDPLTNGHLDIIERASNMFDKLVVGVIMNPQKKSYFTLEEREKMIREVTAHLPNVEVSHFSGLLADYVNENGFDVIVRGLRGTTDFEYELQITQTNHILNPEVETIFLTTNLQYSYLSSTVVKEIASYNGDISKFVPKELTNRIYAKYGHLKDENHLKK